MQIANVTLALAGDSGNTVPKMGVTAAEIPVLQLIHGNDAVTEIEPAGEIARSNRDELARLLGVYGKAQDGKEIVVSQLYPGVAARVFERLDELQIPPDFYKAEKRASAGSAPAVPAAPPAEPLSIEPIEPPDGIEDMDDGKVFG